MLVGLQNLISNYCFIGTTTFSSTKNYVLLLKQITRLVLERVFPR